MQTKLTQRIDKQLVESAKKYASTQGKSVSKMVSDYFILLNETLDTKKRSIDSDSQIIERFVGQASD